jgi:16S rRNA (guanine527-N7)-methyltransferase
MGVMAVDADVIEVLTEAQRLGFLGARPIGEVVEHAGGFVRAVEAHVGHSSRGPSGADPEDTTRPWVIDLGSGGGVPGLVVAACCPFVRVLLVDRRTKRTDFLQRAVRRLAWGARVTVVACDVATLSRDPSWVATAQVVMARGFGPPQDTLRWGATLAAPGGWLVISEPPPGTPDRWDADLLASGGVSRVRPTPPGTDGVVVFERRPA